MESAVGIFRDRAAAERAADRIRLSVQQARTWVLTPEMSTAALDAVPAEDGERPGMGSAVGGVVGGAPAAALTSLLVPPVGAVAILGITVGALAGAGAGAAVGDALEKDLSFGLNRDELFFYEHALRDGRTVVLVQLPDREQADAARRILSDAGADSLDQAREAWWLGVRPEEAAAYRTSGRDFAADERTYRDGFEAAVRRRSTPPDAPPGFSAGFARGSQYVERQPRPRLTPPRR